MSKALPKYYHLLLEAVELREQNRFDKAVADGSIFTDEVIKQKELLFGEHKVIQKRLKEIITILVDEYKMPDSHAKNLVYERTREELPKHMILPNGTYYTIEYQGKVYENTPAQAVFIDNVYQLFLDGQKTFKSQNLVNEIGGYANISALFKNNDIYGSLIKSKRKGIHYLDIKI